MYALWNSWVLRRRLKRPVSLIWWRWCGRLFHAVGPAWEKPRLRTWFCTSVWHRQLCRSYFVADHVEHYTGRRGRRVLLIDWWCRYGLCLLSFHWYPCDKHCLHAHLLHRYEEQAASLPTGDLTELHLRSDVGRRWHWMVRGQRHIVAANQLSHHYVGESARPITSPQSHTGPLCGQIIAWHCGTGVYRAEFTVWWCHR